jgi:hypothetical protein
MVLRPDDADRERGDPELRRVLLMRGALLELADLMATEGLPSTDDPRPESDAPGCVEE